MFFNKFLKRKKEFASIEPDEIFMDSANLPGFDVDMFEGRIDKPIKNRDIYSVSVFFCIVILIFSFKLFSIQIINGEENFDKSQNNRLKHSFIFADRGIIYDRTKEPLAWNENLETEDYEARVYTTRQGFAHTLGYVTFPKKDSAGFYYENEIKGVDGVEKFYDSSLAGENGLRIVETDAGNRTVSDSSIKEDVNGENIHLTIDADLQEQLFLSIKNVVDQVGFNGGGGAIMDIHTGEIIAMTSYPEFDPNVMSLGKDREKINEYIRDTRNPFINRIIQGLFTPGSIVKPYMLLAGLEEGVVDENTVIYSDGKLVIPNPYNPDNPSIFTDWKAHGAVDARKSLAVSSNIYFYELGGGFKNQKGLGIEKINEYYKKFGFGREMSNEFFAYYKGTVPNPEWKEKVFNDEWRLGDTYFTSIGQYGFQVTPIQVLRAVSAIANNGLVIEPKIIANLEESPEIISRIEADEYNFQIIKEGMRQAVTDGTAKGLNSPNYEVAAKTGTAELGVSKANVNSWTTGFFPYDNPKYAFVIVMERGKRTNLIGGVVVSRSFFDWVYLNKPEYLK